jgi:hypothetical protein
MTDDLRTGMAKIGLSKGCHVCGRIHGTRHYFDLCAPKAAYQREMEQRADEARAVLSAIGEHHG